MAPEWTKERQKECNRAWYQKTQAKRKIDLSFDEDYRRKKRDYFRVRRAKLDPAQIEGRHRADKERYRRKQAKEKADKDKHTQELMLKYGLSREELEVIVDIQNYLKRMTLSKNNLARASLFIMEMKKTNASLLDILLEGLPEERIKLLTAKQNPPLEYIGRGRTPSGQIVPVFRQEGRTYIANPPTDGEKMILEKIERLGKEDEKLWAAQILVAFLLAFWSLREAGK